MSFLLDLLGQQITGGAVQQISEQVGADAEPTQKAITASLPVLIGGLARNATKSPDGAAALNAALERDHDGSILDNLGGLLGGAGGLGALLGGASSGTDAGASSGGGLGSLLGAASSLLGGSDTATTVSKAMDGAGILKHILGQKRDTVEQGISKASGLDLGKITPILITLAPIVMGALGKVKQQQSLDAGGVAKLLSDEEDQLEASTPSSTTRILDLLDADNDGQVIDDIGKIGQALVGSNVLGKLFG